MSLMQLDDTLQSAVGKWKAGEPIWTAELGGISPGYEQCIQILLWEIVSRWTDKFGEARPSFTEGDKLPPEYSAHAEEVIAIVDKKLGMSGAQVGAAKITAFQFLHYGYETMMNKLPTDRWMQVSRKFPSWE